MNKAIDKQELIDWMKELENQALINDLRAIKDDYSTSLKWNNLSH